MFEEPQRRYYVNTVSVKNSQSISSSSSFKNSTLLQRDVRNEINFDKENEERQTETQSALPFISF